MPAIKFLPIRLRRGWGLLFLLEIYLVGCLPALAHDGQLLQPHDLWSAWNFEFNILVGLILSLGFYTHGVVRIWRRTASGRGISFWEAAAFLGGWLGLVIALVSPLDALGGSLFSAHMTQHEVLMIVAAPLLILGRPLAAFLWALPSRFRQQLIGLSRRGRLPSIWRFLTNPVTAWLLHAAVLWIWHVPMLFQATLTSELVHATQHASFLFSALLFYESLIYGLQARSGYGVAVLYIFTTAIHTSLLGALLTFSNTIWYPFYASRTAAWGLTPLEDQELGGLIMWIPAGVIYVCGGLLFFGLWLKEAEKRITRQAKMKAWESSKG